MAGSERFRLVVVLLVLLVGFLIAQRLWQPGFFQRAEHQLQDLTMRVLQSDTPQPGLVIVDIDESSLNTLGYWPWPRDLIRELLHILIEEYRAAIVGLDMVFPENSKDPRADSGLAEFVAKHPVVISQAFDFEKREIPVNSGHVSGAMGALSLRNQQAIPVATGHVGNYRSLAESAAAGHITPLFDEDGQVRRVAPIIRWQGQDYPMLPLQILRKRLGAAALPQIETKSGVQLLHALPEAGITLPLDDRGYWQIPYRYSDRAYVFIPVVDILERRVAPDLVAGKIILIGSSSLGLADQVQTPLEAKAPGVLVHAQMISSLQEQMNAPLPRNVGVWAWAGWALTLVMLAFLLRQGRVGAALFLSFAFSALWLALAALSGRWGWQFSVAMPLLGYGAALVVLVPFEWHVAQLASKRLYQGFKDYVPPIVLEQLLELGDHSVLEPQRRELTVLFVDIEGYSGLAEKLQPEVLAGLTNQVLEVLTRVIHQTHGTLDKYMGDALMAFWGAPLDCPDHADRALDAALRMIQEIDKLNAQRCAHGLFAIRVRIGINTGEATVGDMGTGFRRAYTAIGDVVNTAARLQAKAKDCGCHILIGENTAQRVVRHPLCVVGPLELRGKRHVETAFTLKEMA